MKLPDNFVKESTHQTRIFNTLSLTGISFLWAHFLGLISLWFLPLTVALILAGYGTEIEPRKETKIKLG